MIAMLLLGTAPVVFADRDKRDEREGKRWDLGLHLGILARTHFGRDFEERKEKREERKERNERKEKTSFLSGTVTAKSGTTITLTGTSTSTAYFINAADAKIKGATLADIAVGDMLYVHGDVNGTSVIAKSIADITFLQMKAQEKFSHIAAGIVTSIQGAVFTIDPVGAKSTTTVTTSSSTVFKVKGKGNATSSSAFQIGSLVVLKGTTTATSTSGDSFSASIVKILQNGFGHIRFWLRF